MRKIAVLIPCYNEAPAIAKVVSEYKRALPEAVVYVYDNNSTDGSAKIAGAAGAIVREERRQGKGYVIRSMFRDIEADCYLITDGDDTYPADAAREMVNRILLGGCDMVIGDRLSATYFHENKRKFHGGGNVFVREIINRLFGGHIPDIMTGLRAFSPLFAKTFPNASSGFEIETEMTIHALDKKLRVDSVPVAYRNRPEGSHSKLNTYSDGLRVLYLVLRLVKSYKPLLFFSVIGLIFLLGALLLFIPVFLEYLKTGLVPKFPSLIAAVALGIAFLLSLTCGLILENIASSERRSFQWHANTIRLLLSHTEDDKKNDEKNLDFGA